MLIAKGSAVNNLRGPIVAQTKCCSLLAICGSGHDFLANYFSSFKYPSFSYLEPEALLSGGNLLPLVINIL